MSRNLEQEKLNLMSRRSVSNALKLSVIEKILLTPK